MASRTSPRLGGGGGGGPATITFPLMAPPSATANYAFTSGGGLRGTASGGVALAVMSGDALVADSAGNISLAKTLTVQGQSTLAGGLATTTVSADSITTTGNASFGGSLGVSGSAQIDGDLTANKITARAALGAAAVSSTGPIAGASLSIAGKATLGSLDVKGTFRADQIASDGPFLFPTASPNLPGLALIDQPSTGVFAAVGTLGFSVAGQIVASFAGDGRLTLQGNLTGHQATLDGLTAQILTVTGAASADALTARQGSFSGSVGVTGDLTVGGTAHLANLSIDRITTDHDLVVGGNAAIQGTLGVQGAATLSGGLTASGPISLGDYQAGLGVLAGLRVPGGSPANPPVLRVPVPNSPSTVDYVVDLTADGALSISARLYVGGNAQIHGALSVDGALNGSSAVFSGSGSFGGAGAFGADLTAAGAVVAARARLGGLNVGTCQGSPENTVVGGLGDQVTDTQSGSLYLKLSGAGTAQGWVKVATAASSLTFPLQAPASPSSAGPSYAFASSAGDGLGSSGAGTIYLATASTTALAIDGQQAATFYGAVTAPVLSVRTLTVGADGLTVQGATQLAGLQAGSTTVGPLTAQNTTLAQLAVTGTSHLAGDVTADGNLTVGATVQAAGLVASQVSVGAPLVLVGSQRLTAGTVDPPGAVTGSPGDLRANTAAGTVWLKRTGTDAQGWVRLATSGEGVTWPLTAPDGQAQAPSYGFANQTGFTVVSSKLAGIVGGQVGWTLAADLTFALAGPLTVAGATTLAGLTASTASIQGGLSAATVGAGALTVTGTSALAAVTAAGISAASLALTGSASVQGAGQFGGALSGASVKSGPSTWTGAASAPGAGSGSAGDLATIASASETNPLLVRVGSAWKQVAYVGDAAPTQFPLRGPADSAAAPNFAPAATSPGTGIYSPGANQLGFTTNGTSAGTVDAQQRWSLAGALSAPAGTFGQVTVNGPLSASGAATLGSTLQVTGAATFASSVSAASLAASGAVTGASASISGALSAQTASTSGDAVIGGNLTVNGVTTYNGVQKTGSLQVGDGVVSAPAVAFQSEVGLGFYRPAANTFAFAAAGAQTLALAPGLATFPGAVRVGGTNAGLISPGANQLALQTAGTTALTVASSGVATFAFQAVHTGGSTTAPGVALAGTNSGVWVGNDAYSNTITGITTAGTSVAFFKAYTFNSLPVYQMNLGVPVGTTTGAGLIASAQNPNGTGFPGFGGQLFQWQGGGAGSSLFVNEATSGTSTTWAKVLTSSTPVSPSFPLLAPTSGVSAPSYSFTASTNTGVQYVPDQGSGGTAALALIANGKVCAYTDFTTINSLPCYNVILGDPTVSAAPYPASIRASAQAAGGNIIGAPGQLAINNVGGAGTILAVKETGVGTSAGWSFLYTQGTAQIGGQAGTTAAPYHSFSNSLSSGFSYQSGLGIVTSIGGTQVFNIGSVGAAFSNTWVSFPSGAFNQPGIVFANSTTTGFYSGTGFSNPAIYMSLGGAYWGGFVRYGTGSGTTGWGIDIGPTGNFANGGFIVSPNLPTNTATTSPGTLFCSQNGTLWYKESGSQTQTGYAQVLTTSTQLAGGKFAYQSAAPAAVTSVGQVYALTSDGNLYYISGAGKVSNLSAPTVTFPLSNTAPAATYTTVAADHLRTFVNSGTTQSVITLYTVPSGSDYQVTFVVGNSGGFSITAPSSQVIYLGATPTPAANITSATPGSVVTLLNPAGSGTWFAVNLTGSWTI